MAITLTEYVEGHWLPSIKPRVKLTTFDSYERAWVRHIKPALGCLRLQRISPLHINAMYGNLANDILHPTRVDKPTIEV